MSLVKTSLILNKAKVKKVGAFAFNILNLEMLRAVIEAAEETKNDVIVQITSGALKWIKYDYIVPAMFSVAKKAKVNVALHLDHTQDLDLIKRAINDGFSSVMYDGSQLDVKENVSISNKVKMLAKKKNVELEIEIGHVGGKEDHLNVAKNLIPSLEDVTSFYKQTSPDFLAIAFGTTHGKYKAKAKLNFNLIKKASQAIPIPLVMHGTSGIAFKDIKKAVKNGITKINVGTDLLIENFKSIRKYLKENPNEYNIRKINESGIIAMKNKIKDYFDIFT